MEPYQAITELLNSNSVKYDELDHEPVYTSEQAANIRGLALNTGLKSILLKVGDNFVLIVLAGDKKLDSKKLKSILMSKKIRFASPEEVKEKMYCEVGACYPFGSIAGLPTYFDESLQGTEMVSLNPGLHHKSLTLKLEDYLQVEQPKRVSVTL